MAKTYFSGAMTQDAYSSFISAPDGLRLHARCYGGRNASGNPVVCLPGLARTAADFEKLAAALSQESPHPRRVIALDYRGRGLSAYDPDPANYSFPVELADILAVLTALEAIPAIVIGTSRGGILAMLLAAARPNAIAGVVLNDIGPVIEPQGLMRIKSYVGKLPEPRNYEEGAEILRRLFRNQFPRLGPADWLASAHRTFKEENNRLVTTYDPKSANHLEGKSSSQVDAPAMEGIRCACTRAGNGHSRANSDILFHTHCRIHVGTPAPGLVMLEVPYQGHAPTADG